MRKVMKVNLLPFLLIILLITTNDYQCHAGTADTSSIHTGRSQQDKIPSFFSFETSYISDFAYNLSGGIKTGGTYLGMANMRAVFDTDIAGLWKGGQLFVNAANIHSRQSFTEFVGDIQVASNIDAGNHTYIQELWYKHVIKDLEITAGLQDMNAEFASSEYGGLYLNSSFGILPIISGNVCAPIFPLTSLGLTVKWNISDDISWLTALYDGCPTPFENNPFNLNWRFSKQDGIIAVSEVQYSTSFNNKPGIFKAGVISSNNNLFNGPQLNDSSSRDIFGIYFMADQQLWQNGNRSFGVFSQIGYSPTDVTDLGVYFGGGFNLTGAFTKKGTDNLGISVGCVNPTFKIVDNAEQTPTLRDNCETAIELTYNFSVSKHFFIQPDLQYIIKPSGTGGTLNNAFVGILRLGITF